MALHLQRVSSLLVLIFLHIVLHVFFTFNWIIFCGVHTLAKTKWTKTGVKVFRKLVFCYVQMFTFKLKNLTSCYALNKFFPQFSLEYNSKQERLTDGFITNDKIWISFFKTPFWTYKVGSLFVHVIVVVVNGFISTFLKLLETL